MKEIKQKPAGGKPKTADAARVPKAVVKAAWLQAREAARAGEKQVVGGKDGAFVLGICRRQQEEKRLNRQQRRQRAKGQDR